MCNLRSINANNVSVAGIFDFRSYFGQEILLSSLLGDKSIHNCPLKLSI